MVQSHRGGSGGGGGCGATTAAAAAATATATATTTGRVAVLHRRGNGEGRRRRTERSSIWQTNSACKRNQNHTRYDVTVKGAKENEREIGRAPEAAKKKSWIDGNIGTYYSKRKSSKTNRLGDFVSGTVDVDDASAVSDVLFDENAKMKLCIMTIAKELELSEAEVTAKVEKLVTLLPEIRNKLPNMKMAHLVRISAEVDQVSTRLMRFRDIWPTADLSSMLSKHPYELLYAMPMEIIEENMRHLKEDILEPLGIVNNKQIDSMCSKNPLLFLDVKQTNNAIDELSRLLGGKSQAPKDKNAKVIEMLIRDPNILLNVQTGDNLIPYDNGTLKQVQETLEKGPNAAPQGW